MSFCRNKLLLWGQKCIEKGAWYFAPFSALWAVVSLLRHFLYDKKLLSSVRVPCPIISVGNIVAGGTGKTPLVLLLSSYFSKRKVAILSRGYGEIPDEPLLLQNRLKNVKTYVGKDRVSLAKLALNEGADLIFLDDGFQYRKLHRDFDFVLLSASDPWGKGHFLPWGFLRDSPKRLQVADAVFVSGKGEDSFDFPCIHLETIVTQVLDLKGEKILSLQGKKAAIFCGIAKPYLFKETVGSLGIAIVSQWILADHEKPKESALKEFARSSKAKGAQMLLCTEKDAVKISHSLQCSLPVYYVEISFQVAKGKVLLENLIEKIEKKINNRQCYGSRN